MGAYLGLLAATIILFAGGGCATFTARTVEDYDRGQAPAAQFAKDGEICTKQAEADQRQYGMGGEIDPTHSTFNRMFDACMRASGYQRKQVP